MTPETFVALAVAVALLSVAWTILRRRRRPSIPAVEPASRRTTRLGEVVGRADRDDLHVWLGIPFAEPPVGDLRWRAPRPPRPWTGTREALQFGPKPAQIAGPAGGFPRRIHGQPAGSEDCLYLNVWAPRFAPGDVPKGSARLPVMVWIYGGGNATGAANMFPYEPEFLVRQHGVIVVTFNYRLGVLGWFLHPALADAADSEEDRSGNFGTLDVVEALRWVRSNIEAFGGNPDNVTIFGESAGAINVVTMLLSPLARGLFQRAISQSSVIAPFTTAESANYVDDAEPGHRNSSREIVNRLLVRDGRAVDCAAARALQDRMSPAELRDYLRGKSPGDMYALFDDLVMGMYQTPRPIADGKVLPLAPWYEVFADPARYNAVPLILGSNRDEFKMFMIGEPIDYVDLRFGALPRMREPARYEREARYYSDLWKAAAVDEVAISMCGAPRPGVYAYRFDWDDWPKLPGVDLPRLLGAGHGMELFFLFGNFVERPKLRWLFGRRRYEGIRELTDAMGSYWVQFARTGDPGRGTSGLLPEWRPWSNHAGAGGRLLLLDAADDGGIRPSDESITIEGLKARLVADPVISSNENELLRMYARLFAYGLMGNHWDRVPFEPLADFGPQGRKRALLEQHQPPHLP